MVDILRAREEQGRESPAGSPLGDRRQYDALLSGEDDRRLAGDVPHHVLYPAVGCVLALGVPLIAFLLRMWQAAPALAAPWMRAELGHNLLFYLFMAASTAAIFILFGFVMGAHSESQLVRNKALRRRAQELHLKSVTDGLTGAFCHAYLQEMLLIELERAGRLERPVSVLLMDVDDFKRVNDTHGHLFGDQMLLELTETVNMNIRREDVLGRYGGEEFMVIMPGADPGTAARAAERVRRAVERAALIDRRDLPSGPVRMTLSIGAATYLGAGKMTPSGLIGLADRNLYEAKRAGKNRVR